MRPCCLRVANTLLLLGLLSQSLWSAVESLGIENPVAIAAWPGKSTIFVMTKDGKILRWENGQQMVVVADVGMKPAQLTDANFLAFRNNLVSAFGIRGETPGIATFRLDDDPTKPAELKPGLSIPLKFATGKPIQSIVATSVATFVAIDSDGGSVLWRIDAGVATYTAPVKMHVSKQAIRALAMNYQGHLLAAISSGDKAALRFHHASTGDALLTLSTELDEIYSLAVGPDELLYAAGRQGEKTGVYRIDVVYRNLRQATAARLIQAHEGLRHIVCTDEHLILADEADVSRLKLPVTK